MLPPPGSRDPVLAQLQHLIWACEILNLFRSQFPEPLLGQPAVMAVDGTASGSLKVFQSTCKVAALPLAFSKIVVTERLVDPMRCLGQESLETFDRTLVLHRRRVEKTQQTRSSMIAPGCPGAARRAGARAFPLERRSRLGPLRCTLSRMSSASHHGREPRVIFQLGFRLAKIFPGLVDLAEICAVVCDVQLVNRLDASLGLRGLALLLSLTGPVSFLSASSNCPSVRQMLAWTWNASRTLSGESDSASRHMEHSLAKISPRSFDFGEGGEALRDPLLVLCFVRQLDRLAIDGLPARSCAPALSMPKPPSGEGRTFVARISPSSGRV